MNKWLVQILNGKSIDELVCPYCEGHNIKYKETVVRTSDSAGYADVWCADCKHAYHFSRGIFLYPSGQDLQVPEDLKY